MSALFQSEVTTRLDQPKRGDGVKLVHEFHGAEFVEQFSDGRVFRWLIVPTDTGQKTFRLLPDEKQWSEIQR